MSLYSNNMKIIQANSKLFPLIEQFIKPYEEKCIFLASQVRRHSDKIWLITESSQSRGCEKADILGVLYIDSSVFHYIPEPEKIDPAVIEAALLREPQESQTTAKSQQTPAQGQQIPASLPHTAPHRPIHCISGERQGTEYLVNLLKKSGKEPYQVNHYKIMTCEKAVNPPEELQNDDAIIRCTENDMEVLFPIQKKYLSEEVAPFGKKVTDAEVSIGLRQTLKNQLCLALITNDEIAAKANTNAIGLDWIQLGGVYTHPLYRRNGYAWHLVAALCRRAEKAQKKSALFVKDINVPAMELYKKCGFKEGPLYEIAYFD